MKNNNIISTLGVIGISSLVGLSSIFAQPGAPTPPNAAAAPVAPQLSDMEVKEISSYLLGYQHGQRLGGSGLSVEDVKNDAVLEGFLQGLKGDKPSYEEDEIRAAMEALGSAVQARQEKLATDNLAAGKAFLDKNRTREGVTTTASGLQYEVINKGSDKKYTKPSEGNRDGGTKFMVNYRGTLITGEEFDKSPEGKPSPMTLQVIPGFQEALTTMPEGAKWRLFIPSELAYGPRPAGPKIGANSTLVFELEVVEIQQAAAVPATAAPTAPGRPGASAVTPPVPVPAAPKQNK